jgi:hypothetical protein
VLVAVPIPTSTSIELEGYVFDAVWLEGDEASHHVREPQRI